MEQSYIHWIRRFILFHSKRHPESMGAVEVESFLTALAVTGNVAASTQYQSLAVILFLYCQVLEIELPCIENITRANRSPRVPVALTKIAEGKVPVQLPHALGRKYPNAGRTLGRQFVFAAWQASVDPRSGVRRRHHLHESLIQRAVQKAVRRAGIRKSAKSHTLRHSFATHLLEDVYGIRTVQELPGHRDVRTRQIYTQVLNSGIRGVLSPLDR